MKLSETSKHKFCSEAIGLKQEIEGDYLTLGAMLKKIRDEQLWEAGWSSWDEYIMELKISLATASKIINVYKVFYIEYKIPEKKLVLTGGWSVLAEYLPMITEQSTYQEVKKFVEDASTLSRQDIRRNIIEARNGVDMTTCKHPNSFKLFCCPDCGERHKI